VFDLDDTLAVSKTKIQPRMANGLLRLLDDVDVCIISGGRYEQFQLQVLRELPVEADRLAHLHLMPTCGTRYLRWSGGDWQEVYSEDLTADEKKRVETALVESAQELGYWETDTWGEVIEDRGSQVTLSALGQQAPHDAKAKWDPTGEKRRALRDRVAQRLPDLEVRSGGLTSIDVTRKGIDKAHGVRELSRMSGVDLEDFLFVGDRLDEGGNDYPVRALGVRCVEVKSWEQTADYVDWLTGVADEGSLPLLPRFSSH
jgi:HAD superfamily hydrolase (TIGR01484 family)